MCDRARLRSAGQLLLTAASLGVALGVLHRLGGHTRLRVDWGHLELWLQVTPAGDAAVAVLRLVGLGVAYWLLTSTALYLLACLSGLPGAVSLSVTIVCVVLGVGDAVAVAGCHRLEVRDAVQAGVEGVAVLDAGDVHRGGLLGVFDTRRADDRFHAVDAPTCWRDPRDRVF